MTYSNEMLLYLDNNQNNKISPNENYAREFLELFTILKDSGSDIDGDYVNYTEQDIVAAAKVFTGFIDDRHLFDTDANRPWGKKVFNNHDTSNKTFSSAFGGATINGATDADDMDRELWDFIHMVFDQDDVSGTTGQDRKPTSKAYVTKMYRYFVNDKLDDNVIDQLTNDLFSTDATQNVNFLYINVLKDLLKSEHFYADGIENSDGPCNSMIGSKIKSPLELLLTSINLLEIRNEELDKLTTFYSSDNYDLNGYDPEVRTVRYFYANFDDNNLLVSYAGPFANANPTYANDSNYSEIVYAYEGNGHQDLLPALYGHLNPGYNPAEVTAEEIRVGAMNFIRGVFHNYMYNQFGVPLYLCGFNLEGPDTVEGYRGYYKEENYSKNWLDSSNFYNRYSFGRSLLDGKQRLKGFASQYEDDSAPLHYKADIVEWVKNNIDYNSPTLPDPNATSVDDCFNVPENVGPATDANTVVYEMLKYFLPIAPAIGSDRFKYFKKVFLGNHMEEDLSDFAWRVIWIQFIYSVMANLNDAEDYLVEAKTPLDNLCVAITESHEFQTF